MKTPKSWKSYGDYVDIFLDYSSEKYPTVFVRDALHQIKDCGYSISDITKHFVGFGFITKEGARQLVDLYFSNYCIVDLL